MEEHPGSPTAQQSDEKQQQRQQPHSPSPATVEHGEGPTALSTEFLAPKPITAPPLESGRTSEKPLKSETDETKGVTDSPETETSPRGPRVHPAASALPATPNPAAYYKQPDWASTCPTEAAYNVEVIKNGVPLTEDNVNLCSLSEEAKDAEAIGEGVRFCVFGRQPRGAVSPTDAACAKCVTMLHPSISRVHAILQYGSGPPTPTSQTASDQDTEPTKGWHIIDMNSTHGTFVNKRRAPPNRYIRLHVGYVIRLGNSTRLLILQGPETDVEQQTKESWSELVSAHQKRKAEQQLRESKLAQQDREDSERQAARSREGRNELQSSDQRDECTWGIDVDESQDDGEVGGAMMGLGLDGGSCLSHESSYADDPKRALKNYFDREGLDPPPQYEFVEGRFGQKNCRIELPTDSGTVYAEVPVSGNKRKEAIAACALEACRLLDRLGEFDAKEGADAVRKAHEKAYWEANDYYSSDEDPFLDRTGQLEQRRRKRMRRLGAPSAAATDINAEKDTQGAPDVSTGGSLSVLSELETLGAEILKVEEELNEAERALTAVNENASELDELEAYMAAIKNGAPSRAARQALKQRLFELRQKELRLMRQLGIRQPTGFRGAFCSSASSSAAMAVRAALERKQQQQQQQKEPDSSGDGCESLTEQKRSESKLNTLKRLLPSSIKVKISSSKEAKTEEFRPEFDEDEEEDVPAPTNGVSKPEASDTTVSRSTTVPKEDILPSVTALPRPPPPPKPSECKVTTTEKAPKRTPQKTQPPPTSPPPPQPVEEAAPTQRPPLGPQLPPSGTAELAVSSTVTDSAPDSPQPAAVVPQTTVARPPESEEYDVTDPDYALWVPPQNQTGDGITDLNAKYGY